MLGGITLANVRRGIVQAGTIGYWVGQPFAHRGCMTDGPARAAADPVRRAQSAPRGGRLYSVECALDPGAGEVRLSPGRAWRGAISASTASGRTILLFGLLHEDFRG